MYFLYLEKIIFFPISVTCDGENGTSAVDTVRRAGLV